MQYFKQAKSKQKKILNIGNFLRKIHLNLFPFKNDDRFFKLGFSSWFLFHSVYLNCRSKINTKYRHRVLITFTVQIEKGKSDTLQNNELIL